MKTTAASNTVCPDDTVAYQTARRLSEIKERHRRSQHRQPRPDGSGTLGTLLLTPGMDGKNTNGGGVLFCSLDYRLRVFFARSRLPI